MILNLEEACEHLKVSKNTLRRWEKDGKLISIRTPGGHRRYDLDTLNKLFNI
jgi:excisionase family DNA binding protein